MSEGPGGFSDFSPIFKHQLDSFINPVMKLKRYDFKKYSIDPNGVMLYAKAFVTTCAANGLINDRVAADTNTYLDIQTDEINHMTRHHKSRISSLVAQRSWIFIISAVLALTVAIIKIASVIIAYPQKKFHELDITSAKAAIMVLAVMLICWGGYEIAHAQILKHEFRRSSGKSLASRILQKLKVDSDLLGAKLSRRYQLYIKLMDRYLTFGPKRYQWFAGFTQFVGVAALIYGIWRLLSSLF